MSEQQPQEPAQTNTEAAQEKPSEAQPGQAAPEAAKPAEPQAAAEPQEVTYDLKVPEGSSLESKALEDITAFAKAQKLSNEQAQELVAREALAEKARGEAVQTQFKAQVQSWAEEIRSDKEIGGEAFEQNAEVAKRFIDRFGTPELKQALDTSGLGNHPALFKMCLAAGRAMQDDKMVFSGAPSSDEQESPAMILYGNSQKK